MRAAFLALLAGCGASGPELGPELEAKCAFAGCLFDLLVPIHNHGSGTLTVHGVITPLHEPDRWTIREPVTLTEGASGRLALRRWVRSARNRTVELRLQGRRDDRPTEIEVAVQVRSDARLRPQVRPHRVRRVGPGDLVATFEPPSGYGARFEAITVDGEGLNLSSPSPWTIEPGEQGELRARFEPSGPAYVEGRIGLHVDAAGPAEFEVPLRATTSTAARLAWVGPEDVGAVAVGSPTSTTTTLTNRGGATAIVEVDAAGPWGPVTVRPDRIEMVGLSTRAVTVDLSPPIPGTFALELTARWSGWEAQTTVSGVAVRPELRARPSRLQFDQTIVGGKVTMELSIDNPGGGFVRVDDLELSPGAAPTFAIETDSVGPWLVSESALTLFVVFAPMSVGPFSRELAIRAGAEVLIVPLLGEAVDCPTGCSLAGAEPACPGGTCRIGACRERRHDVDGRPETGCECEDDTIGEACATAANLGTLFENEPAVRLSGVIPHSDDVDLVRFFADDGFHVFREDHDVRVELSAADPNIELCIHRRPTDAPRTECLYVDPVCPPLRSYRYVGRYGRKDAADYLIEIRRTRGSSPTCESYELRIQNG